MMTEIVTESNEDESDHHSSNRSRKQVSKIGHGRRKMFCEE